MGKASLQAIQTRYRDTQVAARYDHRYNDLEGRLNYRVTCAALRKALASVPAGKRVLDVPCGTGVFTWFLSELGYRTVASDISLEMIRVARDAKRAVTAGAAHFFEGDIFRLPFRDEAFDAVVCMRFMNLVERSVRIAAVRELARVAPLVVVSYYHQYTFKHFSRTVRHKLGLRPAPNARLSRRALAEEIAETGMTLRRLVTVAPVLSEAWIAVLEHPASRNAKH